MRLNKYTENIRKFLKSYFGLILLFIVQAYIIYILLGTFIEIKIWAAILSLIVNLLCFIMTIFSHSLDVSENIKKRN